MRFAQRDGVCRRLDDPAPLGLGHATSASSLPGAQRVSHAEDESDRELVIRGAGFERIRSVPATFTHQ